MAKSAVYTIAYEGRALDDLLAMLSAEKIDRVDDPRRERWRRELARTRFSLARQRAIGVRRSLDCCSILPARVTHIARPRIERAVLAARDSQ